MASIKSGIILDQIPMPPSENEAYPTDFKTGRRFTSKEMQEFKFRFQKWSIKRSVDIAAIIKELTWELVDHRKCVRVDTFMHFQYESLFTKPTSRNAPAKEDGPPQ